MHRSSQRTNTLEVSFGGKIAFKKVFTVEITGAMSIMSVFQWLTILSTSTSYFREENCVPTYICCFVDPSFTLARQNGSRRDPQKLRN